MADDKTRVRFPFVYIPMGESDRVSETTYRYDPNTRELRFGDRVIGYADLAGKFQIDPEYEEFVRDNPLPWYHHNKPDVPHIGTAQHKEGSFLSYRDPEDIWLGRGSRVPPKDKETLQTQHTSVMIGDKAGLLDEATNKVYDRISMKEIGEVDNKGVLQLNQTTSKYPEYAELRGKPVRKQIPPTPYTQPKDPTVEITTLKPSPPASPDRKGSNAPTKKKSLLTEDYSTE